MLKTTISSAFRSVARGVTILTATFAVFNTLSAQADLVLEDFNTPCDYSGTNEYGAYLAFEGNTTQNGNGILMIQATDNGGLYRDKNRDILWNIAGPTNLVLTVRRLPANQASNCIVVLRDFWERRVAYIFPLSAFSTNSLTSISKDILSPDWMETGTFDFSAITALDIHGGFTDEDLPFAVELDKLEAVGPVAMDLRIKWLIETNTLVLTWNSPVTALLQSCTNLGNSWSDETNVVGSGFSFTYCSSLGDEKKFFRLLPLTNSQSERLFLSGSQQVFSKGGSSIGNPQSGNGPVAANSLFPDLGTNSPPVTYYSNFVDVAAHMGVSTNWRSAYFAGNLYGDFQSEYTLNYNDHTGGQDGFNWRQYTNQTYYPDRTDGYRWERNDNSHALFSWTSTWAADSTNWPKGWVVESGSNSQRTATSPYETYAIVPWSKINLTTVIDPMVNGAWCSSWSCAFTGRVSRVDDTQIHLHTGLNFANYDYKYVLLAADALKVASLSTGLNDPFTPDYGTVAPLGDLSLISWSNLSVLEKPLNADGRIMVKVAPATTTNVTPAISEVTNYSFNVMVIDHLIQNLSRLYHPLFEVPPFTVPVPQLKTLQDNFNNGTEILAADDDTKIADDDPAAANSSDTNSVYRVDDVPSYVEFQITNGPIITNILTRRTGPVFAPSFKSAEYYRVRSNPSVDALIGIGDATIKIVKTLQYNGMSVDGLAPIGTSSMLMVHTLPGAVGPHEWAHTRGLQHRGTASNPGPLAGALMNPTNYVTNTKVNRYERSVIAPPP